MTAIVKYNAGNTRSVQNALLRLGYDSKITANPKLLEQAEHVIFPGVGEATSAMRYLTEKGLDRVIKNLIQPVLGICLGLQLLCKRSEEGKVNGLGIFDTEVKRFPPEDLVPHIGWNNLKRIKADWLSLPNDSTDVYFVHSYYAEPCAQTVAETEYILPFSAALQTDNFYAVQFHPEKSGKTGETILKNFMSL